MVSFKNNTVHFLFQLRVCLKSDICCEVVRMVKHLCPYRIRSATRLVLARRFPTSAAWTLVIMINVTTAKMALSIVRIQRALRRRSVDVPWLRHNAKFNRLTNQGHGEKISAAGMLRCLSTRASDVHQCSRSGAARTAEVDVLRRFDAGSPAGPM